MKAPVVIIGIGEVGGVFARGFLRAGHPVYPVTRTQDLRAEAERLPDPALVVLAVAENAVQEQLAALPPAWRGRLALLQNELLPGDWQRHGYTDPTVISVWFEKKRGQDVKVLLPSPVYGPGAALLQEALAAVDIPARIVATQTAMEFELVLKNVYILSTNIAGLQCGGTVQTLWREHPELATTVSHEVMALQEQLVGHELDREALLAGMVEAFAGDWEHQCMGRSAPARLQRALALGRQKGVRLDTLQQIAANCLES